MSFYSDKKREHVAAAEAALHSGNQRKAAQSMAKAALCSLELAERCSGKIAAWHRVEANEWVDLAVEIQTRVCKPQETPKAEPKFAGSAKPLRVPVHEAKLEASEDWLITEKPTTRLADVAGMDEVKRKLQEMVIVPLRHPEKARQWGVQAGGGILLYGPPGTGKTTLGKAVAGELDADFFYATGAQLRSKWHGESEQKLRKLILAARSRPISVLFLDDLDGLLPRRGGNSVVDNRIVVEFLNQIGGFSESKNTLLLLGATNKPWEIDEGVFRTGRFDEKIFVGLPDTIAREFLVKRHLASAPVANDVNATNLATVLEGYTGSDIVAILQSSKRAGFRRSLEGDSNALTLADIENARRTIPASVTPTLMKDYDKFARERFS